MGFNPIDVVNVISNLLGEKDTEQKTAELMTELEYSHIRDLIPFKYYDSDSGLFINDNSIGFIIETQPLIGANEQLVESFNRVLQSNIPREHYLQVSLLGSKAIKNIVKSPNKNPPNLIKDCVPKESSPKATNSFVIAYTCGIIVKPKNHTAIVEKLILITDRIQSLFPSFSFKVKR